MRPCTRALQGRRKKGSAMSASFAGIGSVEKLYLRRQQVAAACSA
jgi:hypothetical protein